jgi:hypothetical protein
MVKKAELITVCYEIWADAEGYEIKDGITI